MKKSIIALTIAATFSFGAVAHSHDHDHDDHAGHDHEVVTPKALSTINGKPATQSTIDANNAFAETLNFADTKVWVNNERGLVKALTPEVSVTLRDRFKHLHDGTPELGNDSPDTVNPSLWRQAQANHAADGLYQVTDGIYQVRGTDLASATFIKSDSGWIVYDVLMHDEAMRLSLEFFLENVPEGGDLPIVAMLYSHSHADHFGGSRAVQNAFPDVKVYAPHGFIKETVDENILMGNAMSRRASFQYGATLGQAHETGAVDGALSNGWSQGEGYQVTLVAPDETFPSGEDEKFHERTIDGVKFIFMDTAGTEAPSGNVAYLPDFDTLWTGEMTYQGMHNIYTLRGAKVRDALKWSKDINEMINAFGGDVEFLMGSHSAPVFDNGDINEYLKMQRDNYGFVHNQTVRLANQGMTIQDIGAKINEELPTSIQQSWHTNGYHGTYSHNARAVYNMYLGYFDMNPANLNPLDVESEAIAYTAAFGGEDKAVAFAQTEFDKGNYRFVSTMVDKVLRANPENDEARKLLADSFEQQGYQAEGAGWRNVFLTGAQELRVGTLPGLPKTSSPDVLGEMTVANLLDFMAVKVVAKDAEGRDFTLVVNVPDVNEVHYVELSNGNLNSIAVSETREADMTLHINKADITRIMLGQTTLPELLQTGKAGIDGDAGVLQTLAEVSTEFNASFDIVPRPEAGQEVDAQIYTK